MSCTLVPYLAPGAQEGAEREREHGVTAAQTVIVQGF